jgi:hypothetical protein
VRRAGQSVMPIHDWSRVFDGAFHDFYLAWIAELRTALNGGILPPEYDALAEQVARPAAPDVLTLQAANGCEDGSSGEPIAGATAVATAPPRVRQCESIDAETYTCRQRSVVIHHASDDRIVALIEILSAGNKPSNKEFRSFVSKAVDALECGYHLLLIDLQPRTPRDPEGIHPVIWAEFGGKAAPSPPDKPLTLVAYDAGPPKISYVQPLAVGDVFIDMPLFLAPGWYVSVPLEATYQAAWRGVPRRFREILELATQER